MIEKIEIPTNEGTVITVDFENNPHAFKACKHLSVHLDIEASELECKECNKKLNPIKWLHNYMKELSVLQNNAEEAKEAARLYEEKKEHNVIIVGGLPG